jgi:hypothetical protein
MKAPESALARKILDDPQKADSVVDAILSARESRKSSSLALGGKLKVSIVRKVAANAESEE